MAGTFLSAISTAMRLPRIEALLTAVSSGSPWTVYGIGTSNQNVEPLPSSLFTPKLPPMSVTSDLAIARPRPLPPKSCETLSSAWM